MECIAHIPPPLDRENWPENESSFTAGAVMKLMRCGPPGSEKLVLVDADGGVRDLSGVRSDIVPPTWPAVEPGRIGVPDAGRRGTMAFGLAQLVRCISRFMTLNPGEPFQTARARDVSLRHG